jgi:hypothetical protein
MSCLFGRFVVPLLLCFSLNPSLQAQESRLELRSIQAYYLTWGAKTIISMDAESIIAGGDKDLFGSRLIMDSLALAEFSNLDLQPKDKIYEGVKSLDVRMVLKLHLDKSVLQIELDSWKNYSFSGYYYHFSEPFITWINTYVTPCEPGPN